MHDGGRMGEQLATARLTHMDGTATVNLFNPGSSALLSFHVLSGLDAWQLQAGLQLEKDILSEAACGSNATAIERHLMTSLPPTPSQVEHKAFGRLMRKSPEVRDPADPTIRKFEALYRTNAVEKLMHPDAWALVLALVADNMSAAAIARATGLKPNAVGGLLREALSELSMAYDTAHQTQMRLDRKGRGE